jgi:hypothetical protein
MDSSIDPAGLLGLIAHGQISDAIKRAARGADRLDTEIFLSAFHPGAIDHHGYHTGTCEEHAAVMEARHRAEVLTSTHLLGNQYIEINGQEAACETYFFAIQRTMRDNGVVEFMAAGRYLDRCARCNGEWRIAERYVLVDWTNNDEDPNASKVGRGRRDRQDISYRILRSGLAKMIGE